MKKFLLILVLLAFPAAAVELNFSLGTTHKVNVGSTAKAVPDLRLGTEEVLLQCTAACHIAIGITPVDAATVTAALLPANTLVKVRLPNAVIGTSGRRGGISVIQDSSTGHLYVTELE